VKPAKLVSEAKQDNSPNLGRPPLFARSVYLLLAGLGLAPANAGPDNRAPESAKRRPKAR
jgi:hypothetical protein